MSKILNGIICCPDCGGNLRTCSQELICNDCSKKYKTYYTEGKNIPILLSPQSQFNFSHNVGQYGITTKKTWLSNIANFIWPPEATRFYGDLQFKFKIKNYHRGVHNFLTHVRKYPAAVIIDVGGGKRRLGDDVINIDVFGSHEVDIIADANFLPIKTGSVNGAIFQTVIEHVITYENVLTQIHRTLKDSGFLFCEAPFFYPVHGQADFLRFTPEMLSFVLNKIGFDVKECCISMGPFSALSLSLRTILSTIFSCGHKKLYTLCFIIIGWLTFWIKYFDILYPPSLIARYVAPTFYIVVQKRK